LYFSGVKSPGVFFNKYKSKGRAKTLVSIKEINKNRSIEKRIGN